MVGTLLEEYNVTPELDRCGERRELHDCLYFAIVVSAILRAALEQSQGNACGIGYWKRREGLGEGAQEGRAGGWVGRPGRHVDQVLQRMNALTTHLTRSATLRAGLALEASSINVACVRPTDFANQHSGRKGESGDGAVFHETVLNGVLQTAKARQADNL